MRETGWMDRAACRDPAVDPDLFHPRGEGTQMSKEQVARAKAVCRGCEVRRTCLRYALANPDLTQSGVWGGSTPEQRQWARDLDLEVA